MVLKKLNKENPTGVYLSRLILDDGSKVILEWNDTAILDERGEIIEFQSLGRDITESIIAQEELILAKEKAEENDKLKTAFLNNISHELRTPLNGILGFSQLIADQEVSNEERLELISYLKVSSNRLLNTMTDYIDMARLTTGTFDLQLREFYIHTFFEEIVEPFQKLCADNLLDFNAEIPDNTEELLIFSDKGFIRRIMDILLDNALKFTKEGKISCGYIVANGVVEFFVQDTGKGIAKEKLELIFNIFTQEEQASTRGYEGSGLELAIAKGMVNILGGEIKAFSEPGIGSTFRFKIPTKKRIEEAPEKGKGTEKNEHHQKLILVAEDDDLNYKLLQVILDSSGFNHLHAKHGGEAVEMCRQNPNIELVLMDIKMPVMNGIEATKLIKEFKPDLPIIAVTAYGSTGDEQYFLAARCDGYLAKPIFKQKLLTVLNRFIYK